MLGFLKVLKGSYLYERRVAYGLVYFDNPPYEVMQTNWISYDEILNIKLAEEMLEVYYNSGQFEITMKLCDAVYPDAFAFYQKLGVYCEEHGYLSMQHTRIRRSEILLEFLDTDARMPIDLDRANLSYPSYGSPAIKSKWIWILPAA